MSALNGLQAIVVSMVIWQERERETQPATASLPDARLYGRTHHRQAHTKRFFLTRGWEARPHAQPAMQGGGRQAQVAVLVNFDVDATSPSAWQYTTAAILL